MFCYKTPHTFIYAFLNHTHTDFFCYFIRIEGTREIRISNTHIDRSLRANIALYFLFALFSSMFGWSMSIFKMSITAFLVWWFVCSLLISVVSFSFWLWNISSKDKFEWKKKNIFFWCSNEKFTLLMSCYTETFTFKRLKLKEFLRLFHRYLIFEVWLIL